jgi:hypothetical protein
LNFFILAVEKVPMTAVLYLGSQPKELPMTLFLFYLLKEVAMTIYS